MNEEIFNSDRCVVVAYNPGSSGKFLTNCLSFHSAFQPQTLPIFSNPENQRTFLYSKLLSFVSTNDRDSWDDLKMGSAEFFNFSSRYDEDIHKDYNEVSNLIISTARREKKNVMRMSKQSVYPCIQNNKFFFRTCHWLNEINIWSNVWPNRKLIVLENPDEYLQIRYKDIDKRFYLTFKDKFQKVIKADLGPHARFDCMNFFNWNKFLENYCQILSYFELELEAQDQLKQFYDLYMDYWFPNA